MVFRGDFPKLGLNSGIGEVNACFFASPYLDGFVNPCLGYVVPALEANQSGYRLLLFRCEILNVRKIDQAGVPHGSPVTAWSESSVFNKSSPVARHRLRVESHGHAQQRGNLLPGVAKFRRKELVNFIILALYYVLEEDLNLLLDFRMRILGGSGYAGNSRQRETHLLGCPFRNHGVLGHAPELPVQYAELLVCQIPKLVNPAGEYVMSQRKLSRFLIGIGRAVKCLRLAGDHHEILNEVPALVKQYVRGGVLPALEGFGVHENDTLVIPTPRVLFGKRGAVAYNQTEILYLPIQGRKAHEPGKNKPFGGVHVQQALCLGPRQQFGGIVESAPCVFPPALIHVLDNSIPIFRGIPDDPGLGLCQILQRPAALGRRSHGIEKKRYATRASQLKPGFRHDGVVVLNPTLRQNLSHGLPATTRKGTHGKFCGTGRYVSQNACLNPRIKLAVERRNPAWNLFQGGGPFDKLSGLARDHCITLVEQRDGCRTQERRAEAYLVHERVIAHRGHEDVGVLPVNSSLVEFRHELAGIFQYEGGHADIRLQGQHAALCGTSRAPFQETQAKPRPNHGHGVIHISVPIRRHDVHEQLGKGIQVQNEILRGIQHAIRFQLGVFLQALALRHFRQLLHVLDELHSIGPLDASRKKAGDYFRGVLLFEAALRRIEKIIKITARFAGKRKPVGKPVLLGYVNRGLPFLFGQVVNLGSLLITFLLPVVGIGESNPLVLGMGIPDVVYNSGDILLVLAPHCREDIVNGASMYEFYVPTVPGVGKGEDFPFLLIQQYGFAGNLGQLGIKPSVLLEAPGHFGLGKITLESLETVLPCGSQSLVLLFLIPFREGFLRIRVDPGYIELLSRVHPVGVEELSVGVVSGLLELRVVQKGVEGGIRKILARVLLLPVFRRPSDMLGYAQIRLVHRVHPELSLGMHPLGSLEIGVQVAVLFLQLREFTGNSRLLSLKKHVFLKALEPIGRLLCTASLE